MEFNNEYNDENDQQISFTDLLGKKYTAEDNMSQDINGDNENIGIEYQEDSDEEDNSKEMEESGKEGWFNSLKELYEPEIKGVKASTGAYYRALGKRIGNKIQNGHPIRAMARGAAGLAGAATFGAAGLAMGIVSGDASKTFQYASAGALGGQKLGSSTVGAAMKSTLVDEEYLKEQYELAAYGDEYKNYILEQEKEKILKSEKYINYLQKTMSLSREKAQEILNSTGRRCIDSGITSVEDIATVHKMTEGKNAVRIEKAIGAKKFNDLLPSDISKMSDKKRREYIETWTKDYQEAGYGKKSENYAEESMRLAIKFSNTQSSLKKSQV